MTSIGEEAFENCSSLTSVTIPNSVTTIGWDAFHGCKKLADVVNLSLIPQVIPIPQDLTWGFSTYGTLHVLPGCANAYKNTYPWRYFTIVEDAVDPSKWRTLTFGASDYATYCTDENLDFSEVDGVKAYIASSFNPSTGKLTITRVDNVPAGEGFLLKGTAGESYEVPTTTETNVVANLFKGTTAATTLFPTDGDKTNYVLTKNAEKQMGFYRFTGSVAMPANKAWLQIPTNTLGGGSASNIRGFIITEEDDLVTGIVEVEQGTDTVSGIYDMLGRCYDSQPAHGLYIQNGKKIVK